MKKGFSINEVIIVIAIMAVLFSSVFIAFSRLNREKSLERSVSEILSVLEEARAMTLASKNNSPYGVHFQTDKVVLFMGYTFIQGDPNNKDIGLTSDVTISNIALSGGGNDIVFKRLSGETEQDGIITISLTSDPLKLKTISIQKTGIVE